MNRKFLHQFLKVFTLVIALSSFNKITAQTVEITAVAGTTQLGGIGNSEYFAGENLYFNAELGSNFTTAATAINHIEFSINVPGTPTSLDMVSLYLKNSSASTLTASTYSEAGYTLVYTGSVDGTNMGWTGVNLTTEFTRTAGSNLQLMVVRRDGVIRTSLVTYDAARGDGTTATIVSARRYNGTTAPVAGSTALSTSAFRPAIRFSHVNSNDASVTDFALPASSCYNTSQTVGVVVSNTGASPIGTGAASVALTVSGANSYTATLTNTTQIDPGFSGTINFPGISLTNVGTNNIQAIVTFAGDGNAANDTLRTTLSTTTTTTTYPAMEGAENNPLDYFQYLKTVSGSSAWGLLTGKYANPDMVDSLAPHSGNNFYYFDSYDVQNSDAILYSNCFSLPPAGPSGNVYNMQFWMSHDTLFTAAPNTFIDSMYVVVSVDKGITWNRIAGFQRNDPAYALPGWKQETVDLSAYASQTIQLGFEGISKYGNIIGLDDITVNASSTFPVSLLNFSGERAGAANHLSWTTASETNNTGFELQRSIDGIKFSKLSFVATKGEGGNSNRNLKYDFSDNTPFATANYYRLKQIDKDGKFTYSNVVLVKGTKAATLSIATIYPNPAVNNLRIVIASPADEKVTIVVTDLAGKIVMQNATQLVAGDNNLQLDVKGIAKGSYTVKVICSTKSISGNSSAAKFVKQ